MPGKKSKHLGLGKLPTGVEIHGHNIRIHFQYRGQLCREPLKGLPVNKTNIKYAADYCASIRHMIAKGTFSYAKEFPDSRNAKHGPADVIENVGKALDRWLAIKMKKTALSTQVSYEKDVRLYLKPRWGAYHFQELKKTELEHWIEVELCYLAPKTINNMLMPLRSVVADAQYEGVIDKDPLVKIPYMEVDDFEADPFTGEEVRTLLNTPTHRVQEMNYIEFACFSGLSVLEAIALAWEDVDWDKRLIHVERACVLGQYKRPKTKKRRRTLKLLDQAFEALLRQKEYTFNLSPIPVEVVEYRNKKITPCELRFVFHNSVTNKPFSSHKDTEKFWWRHLRKAGIPRRGINQCRHTFASRLLTTGKYPEKWIADYLGHTTTAMLHRHYGKIVKADRPDLEQQASRDIMIGPALTQNQSKEKKFNSQQPLMEVS